MSFKYNTTSRPGFYDCHFAVLRYCGVAADRKKPGVMFNVSLGVECSNSNAGIFSAIIHIRGASALV